MGNVMLELGTAAGEQVQEAIFCSLYFILLLVMGNLFYNMRLRSLASGVKY